MSSKASGFAPRPLMSPMAPVLAISAVTENSGSLIKRTCALASLTSMTRPASVFPAPMTTSPTWMPSRAPRSMTTKRRPISKSRATTCTATLEKRIVERRSSTACSSVISRSRLATRDAEATASSRSAMVCARRVRSSCTSAATAPTVARPRPSAASGSVTSRSGSASASRTALLGALPEVTSAISVSPTRRVLERPPREISLRAPVRSRERKSTLRRYRSGRW